MPYTKKIDQKFQIICAFLLMALCFALITSSSQAQVHANFKIQDKASEQDWSFFMSASHTWQQRLWEHYQKQGKSLADWHWNWRLGWVKNCELIQKKWCVSLLYNALEDKALVVRAQAVKALGRRYSGSKDEHVIKALEKSFANSQNIRRQKTLFIQNYIIFALWQIDGRLAHKVAAKLAKNFTSTQSYWEKIKSM